MRKKVEVTVKHCGAANDWEERTITVHDYFEEKSINQWLFVAKYKQLSDFHLCMRINLQLHKIQVCWSKWFVQCMMLDWCAINISHESSKSKNTQLKRTNIFTKLWFQKKLIHMTRASTNPRKLTLRKTWMASLFVWKYSLIFLFLIRQ